MGNNIKTFYKLKDLLLSSTNCNFTYRFPDNRTFIASFIHNSNNKKEIIVNDILCNDFRKLNYLKSEISKCPNYISIWDHRRRLLFSEEDYKKYKETVFNGLPSIGGINYVYKNDSISKKKHKNFIRDIEESIDPFFTSHQLTSTIIAKFINSLLDEVGICCHSIIPSGSIARRTCITKNKHTIDYDYLVELDTFDDDNILQACNLFAEKTSAKILEGNRPSQWHLGEVQFHDKIIDVDVTFILKLPNNIVITHMAKQLQYTNILKNHGESVLKSILANIIAAKSIFKNALTSKASNVVGLGGIGIETWIVQSGGSMLNAFIDFKTIFSQNLYDIPPEVYNSELLLFNDPGVAHKKDLMNDNYLVSLFSNQKDKSIQHMISIVDSYLEQI